MSNPSYAEKKSKTSKTQQYLPAKCVPSPSKLLQAITDRAGEGNFHIEMQNNMYSIVLHDDDADAQWKDIGALFDQLGLRSSNSHTEEDA
ncbi:hypothetical protein C7974DRAFT_396170 [Boeremia exigua]|uniref:uncharacterized protein n=1 Tax=Boeremia exigua TaxID=749465 RepID=UPI001E8EDF02|nr:uncharacterized protein C7974DRAFT_396170 [Boeremia exigua]KAH6625487.1 hypothetical protein C7974DRAFT_396170 [Boeremia exigua]